MLNLLRLKLQRLKLLGLKLLGLTFLKQLCLIGCVCALPLQAQAKDLQTEEQLFLKTFSGKSRDFVMEQLGAPLKKEQAIKPHNAEQVLPEQAGAVSNTGEHIEMWYYKGKIQYASHKYFNTAELTFANDKCVNITFSNKK